MAVDKLGVFNSDAVSGGPNPVNGWTTIDARFKELKIVCSHEKS
jgi:hypothetical protein